MYNTLCGGKRYNPRLEYVDTLYTSNFTPRSIPGVLWWYDAASINQADGSTVQTWLDSSGNNNTLNQAVAGNKPLYKTNVIGTYPAVRFDGIDDILTSAAINLTSYNNITIIIIIVNVINPGTSGIIYESSVNFNSNVGAFIAFKDTSNKLNINSIGNAGGNPSVSTTSLGSTKLILSSEYNLTLSGNAETQMYFNGIAEGSHTGGTNNTNNFGNYILNFGCRFGGTVPFGGDMVESVAYSNLTTANRIVIQRYYGSKYGITVP